MRVSVKNAFLSSSGSRKLNFFAQQALYRVGGTLANSADYIKRKVVRYAPNREQESFQLTYPGIPSDNFLKEEAGFMYVVDAIQAEQVVVNFKKDTIAEARFGNVAKISPKIGFAWHFGKKKSNTHEIRTTKDGHAFWQNLLEVWEFLGSTIQITARDPGTKMTFYSQVAGKRISVKEQEKTIPKQEPYRMYSQGGKDSKKELYNRIKHDLRTLAAETFK